MYKTKTYYNPLLRPLYLALCIVCCVSYEYPDVSAPEPVPPPNLSSPFPTPTSPRPPAPLPSLSPSPQPKAIQVKALLSVVDRCQRPHPDPCSL